jgi:predicted phage tail component-like protein
MAWIRFKGIQSDYMGVFIEALPSRCLPKRRMEKATIPGRMGCLYIDDGSYEPMTLTVVLNLNNVADAAAVSAWLSGYGELVFSDEPDYVYRAVVMAAQKIKRRRFQKRNYDTLTVTFECDPCRYRAVEAVLQPENGGTMVNPGTLPSLPLLRLSCESGDGEIAVGGARVGISMAEAGVVLIDCEARLACVEGTSERVTLTLKDRAWPEIPVGDCAIAWSGCISGVTVEPRSRWL